MPDSFLGTGWSFPPTFNQATGSVDMTSDEQDVQISLQILLATRKGERVMQPDYGCNLDEMVFEPMTTSFKTYIRETIKTAILFYEPRIELNSIKIDSSRETEGVILIIIDYTTRTTNSRFNFVYPYYKKEGTEIR
jgi:phage baseplate assembly protein W